MPIRYQLKSYRLSKNYTQQYLANKLFISRQQYCNIENGKTEKISEKNKQKLAELLDIPEDIMERMDILVYRKNEAMDHGNATKYNYDDKELIENLKEQNNRLLLLLEKLTDKLG